MCFCGWLLPSYSDLSTLRTVCTKFAHSLEQSNRTTELQLNYRWKVNSKRLLLPQRQHFEGDSSIGWKIGRLPVVTTRGHSREALPWGCRTHRKGMLAFGSKNGFDLASVGTRCSRVPGNAVCQVPTMKRGGNIQLHPLQWKPQFPGTRTEIKKEQDYPPPRSP